MKYSRNDLYDAKLDENDGIYGFNYPWTLSWYLSITGSEYFHIYLWICKDLSWTQEWYLLSLIFGTLSLMWYVVLAYHALSTRNGEEIWNVLGGILWLFANFWWMAGEIHDVQYPYANPISIKHDRDSSYILSAALIWFSIYYLIIIPFNLLPVSKRALEAYDDGQLHCRFSYFRNYRQYENIHTMFWLAKDLAWNLNNTSLWFIFLIPTILLSLDFIIVSMNAKNAVVDTAHYTSTLLWVCGNITWALGEFFFGNYDNPLILWQDSAIALKTARWYASWILLFSFIPLIFMYSMWIPLSLSGKLGPVDRDEILFEGKLRLFDYGSISTDLLVNEDVAANSDTEYVRNIMSNNELDHENATFIKKIFR
mmetsp:Transcript_13526/g.12248  ORF Transcript_13526/g.12248 Transcript_13526/m.12248 type:complete len:368 (-) Transcript_13526:24-1127(-)